MIKLHTPIAAFLFALVALAGCKSTEVTNREAYHGGRVARPNRILVHDFASTPDDIPAWSTARGRHEEPSTPRTSEEIAAGRKLGELVATELVEEIRDMGLPAVRAAGQPEPRAGDIAIVGYFESIDEGSRVKRVAIGFGSGAAHLTTQVEGYLMTEQGPRRLGAGDVAAGSSAKGPGLVVPLAVTIATANPIGLAVGGAVKAEGEISGRTTIEGTAKRTAKAIGDELRVKFEEQGWIQTH